MNQKSEDDTNGVIHLPLAHLTNCLNRISFYMKSLSIFLVHSSTINLSTMD